MPDAEHQPAVHDVRVGRDHPVCGRVRAVGQTRLQADAHPVLLPVGVGHVEVVDLLALCVVHPYGPERAADGLVELENHRLRLLLHDRPGQRRGAEQLRVRARRRCVREQGRARERSYEQMGTTKH